MSTLFDTIPLVMCSDCALIIANGVDPHSDEDRAHLLRMVEYTADWRGTLVVGDETDTFSPARCDTCGTDLAGHRFAGCLLVKS